MGYRRSPGEAAQTANWHAFRPRVQRLVEQSGLPSFIADDREMFDDFLMHGYVDHHPVVANFFVEDLTPAQRTALKSLIVEYLKAGFPDPGLALFSSREHDDIRIAAGLPQPRS